MKRKLNRIRLLILSIIGSISLFVPLLTIGANLPGYDETFAKHLTDGKSDTDNGEEKVWNISSLESKKSFKSNFEAIFALDSDNGGAAWDILRYAGIVLVFVYIIFAAYEFITSMGKPEKAKTAVKHLLYILLGSLLYFGALWIFTHLFKINSLSKTAVESSSVTTSLTSSGGILYFALSLLKTAAFFIAIIMIVYTGFQLMNPQNGESDNGKKLAKRLYNIIFALIALKVVDFIYYIASTPTFAEQAGGFIITAARFLAYVSGTVIVLMIIYSGYLLIIDGGSGEKFKKAKNNLINIVLAVIALFFFLFILYQVFAEFN